MNCISFFSAKADAKLDIQIPELPSSPEKKPRERSDKAKPNRHLIEAQDEFDFFKPDPTVSLQSHNLVNLINALYTKKIEIPKCKNLAV